MSPAVGRQMFQLIIHKLLIHIFHFQIKLDGLYKNTVVFISTHVFGIGLLLSFSVPLCPCSSGMAWTMSAGQWTCMWSCMVAMYVQGSKIVRVR